MSQGTVNIIVKVAGDTGGFKKLTVDAEGFKKVIGAAVDEVSEFKNRLSTLPLSQQLLTPPAKHSMNFREFIQGVYYKVTSGTTNV